MTWLWGYQKLGTSDGKMAENSIPPGLVSEISNKPRKGQMVNGCHLKPAAVAAGIVQPDESVGFHSLRHSLSTWVHSVTRDLKVAQTMLRHSKSDVAAGTCIYGIPEENLKARGKFTLALMQQESSFLTNRNSLMNAKPASDSIQ
jgi:hypothetical protein